MMTIDDYDDNDGKVYNMGWVCKWQCQLKDFISPLLLIVQHSFFVESLFSVHFHLPSFAGDNDAGEIDRPEHWFSFWTVHICRYYTQLFPFIFGQYFLLRIFLIL